MQTAKALSKSTRPSRIFYSVAALILCLGESASATYPDVAAPPVPNPEPTYPAAFDTFSPPVNSSTPAATAPVVAEWSRIGAPADTLVMTGQDLTRLSGTSTGSDTQFLAFGQTSSTNSMVVDLAVQRLDNNKAAIRLDEQLPANSMYLVWPRNQDGFGRPVAVNRAEAWWLSRDASITRSDLVSVHGRNLSHDHGTTTSWVYIKPPSSAGQWATVTSANPYRVQFTIPSTLPNGQYQVWVHNGHGRRYGWSEPLTLTVGNLNAWNGNTFNVKSAPYNAVGDGINDDTEEIEAAYAAAESYRVSTGLRPTVYFPGGTYMMRRGLSVKKDTRILGQGKGVTILRANADFGTSSTAPGTTNPATNKYALLFRIGVGNGNNFEVNNLTIDANNNYGAANQNSLIFISPDAESDIRIANVELLSLQQGLAAAHLEGLTRLTLFDCVFKGGHLFFLNCRDVSVDDCEFKGAYGAPMAFQPWGCQRMSITRTTGFNNNLGTVTGECKGRFFSASGVYGSQHDFYIANNTTGDLAPHNDIDPNTGEQILVEGAATDFVGNPASATATTVNFSSVSFPGGTVPRTAVISSGKGVGQFRRIISFNSTSITVSPAWNVIPDTGSTITIGRSTTNFVVYNNFLDGKPNYATRNTASSGITAYGGCYNFIGEGNTFNQLRTGINEVGLANLDDEKPLYTELRPNYFNHYANNVVQNCYNGLHCNSNLKNVAGNPVINFLGTVFRNNTMTNISNIGVLQQTQNVATPGAPMDLTVVEYNNITNVFKAFDLAYGTNVRHRNTILHHNTASRGTAPLAGSFGVQFSPTQQLPALGLNSLLGFATTFTGTLPGAILEVPYRVAEATGTAQGSAVSVPITIWNCGTASLSWTASETESWLSLSSTSGTVPDQNSESQINLVCNPAALASGTYTGIVTVTSGTQSQKVTVRFIVGP